MLQPSTRTLALSGIGPQPRSRGGSSAAPTTVATKRKHKRVRRLTPKQLQDAKQKQSSDSRLYNLVLDVNNLKQHVRDLMVQSSLLATQRFLTTIDGTGSALKTVREFFIVCSGFEPGNRKPLAFFQAVADPGFRVGTTNFGIEMVFAQFVRYNESFNSHGFTLGATTILVSDRESCVVQTLCMFHGRISRTTLVKLFPAALPNEALVAKLVDRELHFPVKTLFYFRDRLMTRMDVDSDILAGFSELLNHNPFELAALMSNAVIAEESMIGGVERTGVATSEMQQADGRVASSPLQASGLAVKQRELASEEEEELRLPLLSSLSAIDGREEGSEAVSGAELRADGADAGRANAAESSSRHSLDFILS